MQPKVSVIVPVYNAGSHLSRCLETLTHQTLRELEIILVLDCPTDGSDRVAEEYAQQYANIKLVYNTENLHIGESRNRGLAVATGEYIGFADNDDFQELRMFEDMYKAATQQDADIVLVGCMDVRPPQEKTIELKQLEQLDIVGGKAFLQNCFFNLLSGNYKLRVGTVHSHIFRRKFLEDFRIQFFDTKQIIGEDLLFNVQVYGNLVQGNYKFIYLPQAYYYYVIHPGSLSHKVGYYRLDTTGKLFEKIGEYLEQSGLIQEPAIADLFAARMISSLYSAWSRETLEQGPLYAFRKLWKIRKSQVIRRSIKRYSKIYNSALPLKKNICGVFLRLLLI